MLTIIKYLIVSMKNYGEYILLIILHSMNMLHDSAKKASHKLHAPPTVSNYMNSQQRTRI